MNETPRDGARLVYDFYRELHDGMASANRVLDAKMLGVAALGAALAALGAVTDGRPPVVNVAGLVAFGVTLFTLGWGIRLRGARLPGNTDWENLCKKYLSVDGESALRQVLADLTDSTDSLKVLNERKGEALDAMTTGLLIQAGSVLWMMAEGL